MYNQREINYWTPDNTGADYQKPIYSTAGGDAYSSLLGFKDASFIKIRNISLGYTFPKNITNKLGMSNLKVYVQAMNPFTIYKKCKWLDTDLLSYDNNSASFGSGTTIKSWVIGLNIGF